MDYFFESVLTFLNSVVGVIGSALTWVTDAIGSVLWGFLYLVISGLLSVVSGFVSLIDLSTIATNLTASWGLLPPQVVWVINQSGLADCLAIIGYAYIIRMTLNLIPSTFTRV